MPVVPGWELTAWTRRVLTEGDPASKPRAASGQPQAAPDLPGHSCAYGAEPLGVSVCLCTHACAMLAASRFTHILVPTL